MSDAPQCVNCGRDVVDPGRRHLTLRESGETTADGDVCRHCWRAVLGTLEARTDAVTKWRNWS